MYVNALFLHPWDERQDNWKSLHILSISNTLNPWYTCVCIYDEPMEGSSEEGEERLFRERDSKTCNFWGYTPAAVYAFA